MTRTGSEKIGDQSVGNSHKVVNLQRHWERRVLCSNHKVSICQAAYWATSQLIRIPASVSVAACLRGRRLLLLLVTTRSAAFTLGAMLTGCCQLCGAKAAGGARTIKLADISQPQSDKGMDGCRPFLNLQN